jgi:hypothetical protein
MTTSKASTRPRSRNVARRMRSVALGPVAARAFCLFERGWSVARVASALSEDQEIVWRLFLEYATPLGKPVPAPPKKRRH